MSSDHTNITTKQSHNKPRQKKKKKKKQSSSSSSNNNNNNNKGNSTTTNTPTGPPTRKLLVLHGDRQTGDLFLGRIAALRKKLMKPRLDPKSNATTSSNDYRVEIVSPDGPFQWQPEMDNRMTHHSFISSENNDNNNSSTTTTTTTHNQEEDDDTLLRTWWRRDGNVHVGIDESLALVHKLWTSTATTTNTNNSKDENEDICHNFEGILGFSRGARLAHFIGVLHASSSGKLFPNLKYIIFCGGYGDHPIPNNLPSIHDEHVWGKEFVVKNNNDVIVSSSPNNNNNNKNDFESVLPIDIPTLHIMGQTDRLIPIQSSQTLLSAYVNSQSHVHEGGHHVPMRGADLRSILSFIDSHCHLESKYQSSCNDATIAITTNTSTATTCNKVENTSSDHPKTVVKKSIEEKDQPKKEIVISQPDEEHAQFQIDECESLAAIFPDEFQLLSGMKDESFSPNNNKEYNDDDIPLYNHPISYKINLKPPNDQMTEEEKELWPIKDIALKVQYTSNYPDMSPIFSLDHEMNLLELKISQINACLRVVRDTATAELGMPCVMSCVYAAQEFFQNGGLASSLSTNDGVGGATTIDETTEECVQEDEDPVLNDDSEHPTQSLTMLRPSSQERIQKCILEGNTIASNMLALQDNNEESNDSSEPRTSGKGGRWSYTVGLVGKPSCGKSTFFNSATAFARQRGDTDGTPDEDGLVLGGAAMDPRPFTTIDPNVGWCLVPAPEGSCPSSDEIEIGSTHGYDSKKRRLIPVHLKDVAGLVPGAYQGRGRGNKFLDDLTDADVLVHVVDSSGQADTEGNNLGTSNDSQEDSGGSHPLNDLSWVQNELIQWVFLNLHTKWDKIARHGRDRFVRMFSGYKQNEAFVWRVLLEVEKFMYTQEGRDHALDHLKTWDEGDLYRLVSAFLGIRFPMALALNKIDIPTAQRNYQDVLKALPTNGAHVGIPLSARHEMNFMKYHICSAETPEKIEKIDFHERLPPVGVWNCLQSAIQLREPVLVFPVVDHVQYLPLSGMNNFATRDSSLPTLGMISSIVAAGGSAPTLWDNDKRMYVAECGKSDNNIALRDVIVLKPGSTIGDVFEAVKNLGAIGGEFVRCEAAGEIGQKPKQVKKEDIVSRHNRIVKIMTTKRKEWQKSLVS